MEDSIHDYEIKWNEKEKTFTYWNYKGDMFFLTPNGCILVEDYFKKEED